MAESTAPTRSMAPTPAAEQQDKQRVPSDESGMRTGLVVERLFTEPGIDPFDAVAWERRDALINNEKGEVVFEQKGVEIPSFWSQTATNVVVSKYFRGSLGTPARESSVRQLI